MAQRRLETVPLHYVNMVEVTCLVFIHCKNSMISIFYTSIFVIALPCYRNLHIEVLRWYSEVRYKLDSSSGIWIGLNDLTTAFVWEWDDKSSYNWNYWDVNVEPSANISNRCILSVQSLTGQYVWRRESCNYNAAVICQIRVPPLTTSKYSKLYLLC